MPGRARCRYVARRGRAIELVSGEHPVAQLERIAAQEDHRVGARAFGCGAVERQDIVLPVDLDPHATRPVAERRIGDHAVHGLVTRERLARQPGEGGEGDHSIRMSML